MQEKIIFFSSQLCFANTFLKFDNILIKIQSKGIDTAKLLSMLVNAISITILNASNGDINKKDELVNQIVGLLKGE